MPSINFSIRLNEKESEHVKQAANKIGWSQTQLMKRACLLLAKSIKEVPNEDLGELITNLVCIEVELN